MASYYRQQLEDWLKTIDVKADRVLDIGGGANPVKGRTKSWEVREYEIVDNNAEGEFVEKHNFIDLNKPYQGGLPYDNDIIFCLEVFEYLFRPLLALKTIHLLLKKGGIVYISFPSIYPVHNPKEIDYLRYTKFAIEKLLKVAGFTQWEIRPRVATEGRQALSAFYSLEKMHPVKNDPVIYDIGYLVEAHK